MNKIEIPSIKNIEEGLILGIIYEHQVKNTKVIKLKACVPLRIEGMYNLIFNEGETIQTL